MKIRMTTTAADRVLAALRKLDGPACYAVPYLNGREKGWTLFPEAGADWNAAAGVTFSEYRSSDDIVLYTGTNPHIQHEDGQPVTEEIGNRARFFGRDEHAKAALAAVAFLKSATNTSVGGTR